MSSITPEPPALLAGLASLAAAPSLTVGADGFNEHFSYSYMTEEALFSAARAALAANGLSGTISFESGQHEVVVISTENKGERPHVLATITAVLAIRDTNGQAVEMRAVGQGLDPSDKAYAKAMTMAAKYVVQKGLMIAVEHGDDTDSGGDAGSRTRSGGGRRSAGGGNAVASDKQLGFLCALVKKGHYIENGSQADVEHMALRLSRMQAGEAGMAITEFVKIPKAVASELIEKLQLIPVHRAADVLDRLAQWEAENSAPPTSASAPAADAPTAEAEAAASTAPVPAAAAPSDDDDIPFMHRDSMARGVFDAADYV